MNPPKAPKQASQPTYYSDSPEEGSDEELKAMQNIRNRGRKRWDEVCCPDADLPHSDILPSCLPGRISKLCWGSQRQNRRLMRCQNGMYHM